MELKRVDSSSLSAVGYDRTARTLVLAFKHGGTYAYFDVPPSRHRALLKAKSMGEHFMHHIRDRYRCLRLALPDEAG